MNSQLTLIFKLKKTKSFEHNFDLLIIKCYLDKYKDKIRTDSKCSR